MSMVFSEHRRSTESADEVAPPKRFHRRVVCAVFASFFLVGALQSPVPAVNEPHYLTKAKHYWNPDWCAGDFFLESSNAHLVFYQLTGWLTRWATFEQTAWLGRLAALGLLSFGWTALLRRLTTHPWSPLWGAWGFLILAGLGNFSGEWMVGGVESKVFSYGLILLALAFVIDRSWKRAALCGGWAVSLHPVVGVWNLMAVLFAESVGWWDRIRRSSNSAETAGLPLTADPPASIQPEVSPARNSASLWNVVRSGFRGALLPLSIFVLCALPGLGPALSLLGTASPKVSLQADYIQVFYRLGHHLDPTRFPLSAYIGYGVLLAVWILVQRILPPTPAHRFLNRFVLGATLIALAGLIIGYGPRPAQEMPFFELRTKLMKFYPFRLFDVMLPLAVVVLTVRLVEHRFLSAFRHSQPRRDSRSLGFTVVLLSGLVGVMLLPTPSRNPSRMSPGQLADWKSVCRWIEAEIPANAHFLTPRESWAFKWYAQRAEYVNFKDCPQDAEGIVEWNRRQRWLRRWGQENYDKGMFSVEALRLLKEEGITHLLVRRLGPFEIEPIHVNQTYKVYSLLDLPTADSENGSEEGTASHPSR